MLLVAMRESDKKDKELKSQDDLITKMYDELAHEKEAICRHAARKTQGCYRELMPTLEYVKQEQKQEKPSIRDQLRTAAKQQPEKKSPVKSKTHDMEL